MSRINTNVSSLIARHSLLRSNQELQTAMTRLSTGLQINSGKDDPAGLIASENLRRDIAASGKAISNSERAMQLIATADSALGQVSELLIDIRGLVTEAANEGAMSDEQIAANQLQIDSSLKAIDRISRVTTFQGRKLLDGSLDFTVTGSTNFSHIDNLQVSQANLGTADSMDVSVTVATAATQAQVDLTDVPEATAAVNAYGDLSFSSDIAQASGTVTLAANSLQLSLTVAEGGTLDGAAGNITLNVSIVDADTGDEAVFDGTDTLTVTLDLTNGSYTLEDLVDLINTDEGDDFVAAAISEGTEHLGVGDADDYNSDLTGGRDAGSATIRVTADTAGADANGVTVIVTEDDSIDPNTAEASLDDDGNIDVLVNGTVSYAAIAAAIDSVTGYSASLTAASGDSNYVDTLDTPPDAAELGGGVDAAGGLAQDVVFELSGLNGSEVFTFSAGTSISLMADAINAMSTATGVSATVDDTTLQLVSEEYGSRAFVDIKVIAEAAGGTIQAAVGSGTRDTGTDVVATVNGMSAKGDGNTLSLNSTTLDVSMDVDAGWTGTAEFTITGGGALFQLGPSVVPNQQERPGIGSVHTATLGGSSGLLYQLRSGGAAALDTDPSLAASIVDEVITKVVELRGRLGAFQRTMLETNIASLQDTVTNLTDAESAIRDADFAKEAAALTRAQILVQSGTSVLAIANQNPQNVLALLR